MANALNEHWSKEQQESYQLDILASPSLPGITIQNNMSVVRDLIDADWSFHDIAIPECNVDVNKLHNEFIATYKSESEGPTPAWAGLSVRRKVALSSPAFFQR